MTRKGFAKKEQRFFAEAREAWAKVSEGYRQRYAVKRDPDELAAFLTVDPRAIKEAWVADEVIRAIQDGRGDLCRAVASVLANRRIQSAHVTALHSLATMLEIDRLVESGQCRTQAEAFTFFLNAMTELQPGDSWTSDRVRNEYFRARRRKPRVHVEDLNGWTCVSVCPAVVEMNGRKFAGRWELRMCPGKEDETSFWIHPFALTLPQVSRTPAR